MIQHIQPFINYAYILAAILFVFGLKMLSRPTLARRGNLLSGVGMVIAIAATCLLAGMDYRWILIGAIIGAAIGTVAAVRVKMTAMPEMVGLLNGCG